MDVVGAVGRELRLAAFALVGAGPGAGLLRRLPQAVEQVVHQRCGEQGGRGTRIADPPAGGDARQVRGLDVVEGHLARGGVEQPRHEHGGLQLAARRVADQRHMAVGRDLETDSVDKRLAVLGVADIGRAEPAGEFGNAVGADDRLLAAQARRRELGDHLVVLDPGVLANLVVVQQLLPGRRQVLVGGQDGDQGAQRKRAVDHEVAADRVEEERRDLGEEVVEELDEELLAVDPEADVEDAPQAPREVRQLPARHAVGVHFLGALHGLRDPLGDLAHLLDAPLGQQVHASLKSGNDPALHRIERDRGQAHPRILHEDEDQRGDQKAALVHGQRQGVADEAAERLDLLGDHRDQFAGADPPEMRQGEAHDAAVELVAQATQHAFAQKPLVDVDDVLEAAVDQHEQEKQGAVDRQQGEPLDLADRHAEQREVPQVGPVRAGQGRFAEHVVDDELRNVQGQVVERQRAQGEEQDEDLPAPGMAENELVDGALHDNRPCLSRRESRDEPDALETRRAVP